MSSPSSAVIASNCLQFSSGDFCCCSDKEDKIETAIDSVGDDLETLASDIGGH